MPREYNRTKPAPKRDTVLPSGEINYKNKAWRINLAKWRKMFAYPDPETIHLKAAIEEMGVPEEQVTWCHVVFDPEWHGYNNNQPDGCPVMFYCKLELPDLHPILIDFPSRNKVKDGLYYAKINFAKRNNLYLAKLNREWTVEEMKYAITNGIAQMRRDKEGK